MRVMVIGASANPEKFGHKAVVAYMRQGNEVFPVNPHAEQIAGLHVYRDVRSVPGPIDRATVYLPPDLGLEMLDDLAERDDVSELWLNPGAESEEVIARARELGFEPIVACSIVAIGEHP